VSLNFGITTREAMREPLQKQEARSKKGRLLLPKPEPRTPNPDLLIPNP
jgi:hypothetical protein